MPTSRRPQPPHRPQSKGRSSRSKTTSFPWRCLNPRGTMPSESGYRSTLQTHSEEPISVLSPECRHRLTCLNSEVLAIGSGHDRTLEVRTVFRKPKWPVLAP
jgi:hypothetical protein